MRGVGARVSTHAIVRWQQRVDPEISFGAGRRALDEFLAYGRARPTPRSWMREVAPAPGLRFVYSVSRPGVCVLVREGVAVTVVTRVLMRRSRRGFVKHLNVREAPARMGRRWHGDFGLEEAA
jgi:hypothetical protein